MSQVALWRTSGPGGGMQLDYAQLRGGTGPLVYPAGHLYLYGALQWLAGGAGPLAGWPLLRVQAVFLAVYLASLWVALRLLATQRAAAPPWAALLLAASYRLHSLYSLRLFNDCFSALGVFAAVLLLCERRPLAAALAWSAGVGVKMNGLLVLPALGLLLARNAGPARAALCLAAAAALQLALAAPFLAAPAPAPQHYLARAFALGRESRLGDVEADRTQGFFLHQWSVNWGFVPTALFVAPGFARALLAAHLAALAYLAHAQWCSDAGGLPMQVAALLGQVAGGLGLGTGAGGGGGGEGGGGGGQGGGKSGSGSAKRPRRAGSASPAPRAATAAAAPAAAPPSIWQGAYADSPAAIARCLLACNFVGIALARSLHYQFYTWYAATLPVLAWGAAPRLPLWLKLAAIAAIEAGFSAASVGSCVSPAFAPPNCAPWQSSVLVAAGHAVLLAGILAGPAAAAAAARGGKRAA
jgi:hypothetical protein